MKVISFNVNGLRARLHQLEAVIAKHQPDIIGLQETKVHDSQFPAGAVQEMGYQVYYHGQKAHYGVALLCRQQPDQIFRGFPGDGKDAQRRIIGASFPLADGRKATVLNGYFPQGDNREHPVKFPAKQKFYQDLQNWLHTDFDPGNPVIIMGDMNISHTDSDIGIGEENRKRWLRTGKCSFLPEEREWLNKLFTWGLADTFRTQNPDTTDTFSWFDYRSRGFADNPKRGLRIDLIMATKTLMDSGLETGIDYDIRGMEKPSDHCPIWATFGTELTSGKSS